MGHVIALANQKGGVGKTTTTVNIAGALARAGKKVLMVDFDPQSSLTQYFYPDVELSETMYDVIINGKRIGPLVVGDTVHLLPADINLAAAEIQLPSKMNQERTLGRMLKPYVALYDYCLIDCQPSLGVLTVNALTAAHAVIIPVVPERVAVRSINLIFETIANVRDVTELNPQLKTWRILPTLYNARLSHHQRMLQQLHDNYDTPTTKLVYDPPVKLTTLYKDASERHVDVRALDRSEGEYWDTFATRLIAESEGWYI